MKIAVIGGGGVRSPLLARSIAYKSKEINISEVVFMDNDKEKLDIYGQISKITSETINPCLKFILTDSFEEAVGDADYIITTIRVGNDDMRILDERTALSRGVIGQETTGAAGISFAMRSVTVLSNYLEIIKKISAKNVKVFNFTNPAGIVTQVLRDMGYDFCYGICDAPTSLINSIVDVGGYDYNKISFECFGLNHFSFISSIKYNGYEIIDEILSNVKIHDNTDLKFINMNFMKEKKTLFNEYLYYYLYPRESFENISNSVKIRSEIIQNINVSMTKELKEINIEDNFQEAVRIYSKWYDCREKSYMENETGICVDKKEFVFDINDNSKSGYASIALDYIEAVEKNVEKDLILCTTNEINSKFSLDDVIEVSCTVNKEGIKVHDVIIEDQLILELIRRMKQYEKMASKALRSHKKEDFINCLILNPLVSSYSTASKLTNDFFNINKEYFEELK